MYFDLHTHTIYSDGTFTPKELIQLSLKRNLDGISITDHDCVDGIDEALNFSLSIPNFKIIPGIEFSCIHNDEEIHILGYFIDYKSKILTEYIKHLKDIRFKRAQEVVYRLNDHGIKIKMPKFISNDNILISRTHIARELVRLNHAETVNEAFEKYLRQGRLAYVPKEGLNTINTISLIKELNGIPVLAHPGLLKEKATIEYCKESGILGIECIHSKHSISETENFTKYAKKNRLIATGGSDCHGEIIQGELLLGKYVCSIEKGDILYDYL